MRALQAAPGSKDPRVTAELLTRVAATARILIANAPHPGARLTKEVEEADMSGTNLAIEEGCSGHGGHR